jgi:hypothetical protein
MKNAFWLLKNWAISALVPGLLVLAVSAVGWAMDCGNETLKPYGDLKTNYMTDLKVVGTCNVNGTPKVPNQPLLYVFHNVNIVAGGALIFNDKYDIDFYAENIVIENQGKLIAVSTQQGYLPQVSLAGSVLPYQKRLTFHLWGPETDPGVECASDPQCGIPNALWTANQVVAMNLMMTDPPPPTLPRNNGCVPSMGYGALLPENDCFYQYEIQDKQDKAAARKAYFGHKVLALSFGGTLQLFGSRGVSYLTQGQQCQPTVPNNECNPAFTGTSWVRLTGVTDATHITVSRGVDWKMGDHIVVTPTDYLPSHAQEVVLAADAAGGTNLTLQSPGVETVKYNHRATTYSLAAVPASIGPQNDPNIPEIKRAVDTRAAVALLTRNIQIVSEGDVPSEPLAKYYGGHTIVRQGFASFQVQGVGFYLLGQGGALGRYPVHFHMARKTAQPAGPASEPLNYLKDCSISDSMTRWITVHATEGMYLARNVGYKSIGHGFYLEDATEIDNRFYSNIGILARAAIQDPVHNPRQVPGILADTSVVSPDRSGDYMPYRSDYNHPTIFWITNGWNDFQYNFAAGAATCGACYWWLPAANSGISQYENWDSYASQQIDRNAPQSNWNRAGITPLKSFVGNTCVAAMTSFQMNGQTGDCLGVGPPGVGNVNLSAVPSSAPPGPSQIGMGLPAQPFQLYYPVVSDVHNPTLCPAGMNDCSQSTQNCDGADTHETCAVTQLDRYTTSFNFAQTNFAAVWLRKGWDLVSNLAMTDVLQSGLNFITGGGYTRSDVNLGEWMVARDSVFIGHSQGKNEGSFNPFAEDVGPFNPDSKQGCDNGNQSPNHCEFADGGVSFELPAYPAQKLINIYDGPSQQQNNAYLDINASKIPDCKPGGPGNCYGSPVPLAWNVGVLTDKKKTYCYLPNAAIGWKQPNGFYYPPAFHSLNLWFSNVDIRHFVIEPLFLPITPLEYNPFQQNQKAVEERYCTYTSDMFSDAFNAIDRQTVLNDDDGTLTGLVGLEGGVKRPAISINEDPYFNAPLTTPECLSDIDVKPLNKSGQPYTATTSPYEWLSTAMIADCAITNRVGSLQCYDPSDKLMKWGLPCTYGKPSFPCRGVPLYREYLTTTEQTNNTRPQMRMMGQGNGQRSTLSLNHGAYYIDTTQDCLSQAGCPMCVETEGNLCKTYGPISSVPSVFRGGHTYYVYFIYASATTQQKYDIYVGPNTSLGELKPTAIQLDPNDYKVYTPSDSTFIDADYTSPILTVKVDLTKQTDAFTKSSPLFCRPQSYCSVENGVCGCKEDSDCQQDSDCAWGPRDIDCPVDPKNVNGQRCFGFSFTLPANFAPPGPIVPDNDLFVNFSTNPYFAGVKFANGKSISPKDACVYDPLPTE